ncbi:MAG: CPBP family intramembrane metalloprotease [Deltaproteobacteria bacterium]|nr:CPBP family intramembrane metalloprotease [Deltaproteobacteria bacterium]
MKVFFLLALLYLAVVALINRRKLHELHPKVFFLETWREIDALALRDKLLREALMRERALASGDAAPTNAIERELLHERLARSHWPYDWRPLAVLASMAFVLTMHEYFGDRTMFYRLRDRGLSFEWGAVVAGAHAHSVKLTGPWKFFTSDRWGELWVLVWWAASRGLGYLLPIAVFVPLWRERFRDYGLSLRGFADHAWIYAMFFGIVLLCVIGVAHTGDFATYYPFYKQAHRSWGDFFLWESVYATQFFALEFYFRGFLVFAIARALGSGAIFAMVVPYCMIHFGKPVLETLGAIIAGIVLGTLALRTRSIWSGFLIHVTVAISMDVAAMLMGPGLPGGLKPPMSWNF